MRSKNLPQEVIALCLLTCLLISGVARATQGQNIVSVIAQSPLEHLDSTGHLDSVTMATPHTQYQFVRTEGDKVVVTDSTGAVYRIAITATDYVAPAPVTTPAPQPPLTPNAVVTTGFGTNASPSVSSTNANPTQTLPASPFPISVPKPVTNAASTSIPTPAPAIQQPPAESAPAPGADNPKMDGALVRKFNQAFHANILSPENLWSEQADKVGARLGWKKDSLSSYRHADPNQGLFGSRLYASVLYSHDDKPDYFLFIFSNNGAAFNSDYTIRVAIKTLHENISRVFGQPTDTTYGGPALIPAERWDWNGISLLLLKAEGQFAGLIVCPYQFADNAGIRKDWTQVTARQGLSVNVVRDGDRVFIKNIPDVNQGDTGYCVPASYERYLRYLGIPANMYLMVDVLETGERKEGTTHGEEGIRKFLTAYGLQVTSLPQEITLEGIAQYIDRGEPVFWYCRVGDGHTRLIVGYNAQRKEIAYSDSWADGSIRWISLTSAYQINYRTWTLLE